MYNRNGGLMVYGKFKEVHLGDHADYDRLRNTLGLKKDNKNFLLNNLNLINRKISLDYAFKIS